MVKQNEQEEWLIRAKVFPGFILLTASRSSLILIAVLLIAGGVACESEEKTLLMFYEETLASQACSREMELRIGLQESLDFDANSIANYLCSMCDFRVTTILVGINIVVTFYQGTKSSEILKRPHVQSSCI